MAKTVSEEEIQLRKRARRRLVGAITLAAAAVVILPMVLDSKPEQRNQEIDIRIPAEDSADEFVPGTAPRMEPPATAVPQQSATGVQQEERVESRPPVKPSQSRAEPVGKLAGAGKASDSAAEAGSTKAAAAEQFVVQLGAFSDPAKARQQQQSLISKDARKVYTETLKADKGEITRVRVGPFRTREEAEGAREKLKKLGFDGVVTDK
ncbi:DedD protein [Nitrosospira sp. Nl5]|uniref:SPOR domain-containing protein n=1 Tax=Nitrosospira sp. Nl5 TaxID=200120 RepID=UPI00087F2DF6|nr:SPOR domain-containing protein [Nitrosospira sp. Nl5]SCX84975.1 DedD protein [Nitrosospira sp. Nl5]